MKRRAILLAGLAASLAGVAPAAQAQTVVGGVRFEPAIEIGGSRLQLNGAGLRQRFRVGIYAAGLYVMQTSADPEQLVTQPGPKRVALRFLREVDGELFVSSLHNGLKANHSAEQLAGWRAQIDSLTATISTIARARRGDSVSFDFNPAEGIRVTFNGTTRGPVIPGEDFYAAVLRVWIGAKPADEGLKKGVLGG